MKLSIEDRLILSGAKLNPGNADIVEMGDLIRSVTDWEYFAEQAIHNGVGPVIYHNFSSTGFSENIPPELFLKLKQSYYRSLSRNIVLYDHFRKVITALNAEGIEVIALKGIYLAETLYHDIGLRQMVDIDLLVEKENTEKCQTLLINMGFVSTDVGTAKFMHDLIYFKHLSPLVKDGVSVEIHSHIQNEHPEITINIDEFWKRSVKIQIAGVDVNVLSHEDLLQHLCLHIDEHFDDGKPQLYSLLDIATIIEKYSINWDALINSCKKYNCSNRVFRQLYLTYKYFNARIPDNVISVTKPYFDNRLDRLFIHYLQHQRINIPLGITNRNIDLFKNRKGFKDKCLYIIHDLFPAQSFMIGRYRIRRKYFLPLYYIFRLFTGIYKLILEFFRILTPSAKSRS